MNTIELLAPAKNKECAFAAINCGADAVYIAATDFGARKNAANNLSDIQDVVIYAHKFNVKVYVTLNTILTDEELEQAKNLIKKLESIHVDAIIIQDFGLLNIPHKVPFHASTQCDIRTVEKVKFLENIGFERIVLARELSLNQIKEIKKHTSAELEVFIHGALCVCYSGQCYLSQAIGQRSANRGECAQPCRKKYSLIDDKGNILIENKHLLALKDFNASKHIKELAQIGVKSFKIEGRLKDVNYVKNVVAYYRKLIDSLNLKKTSWGYCDFDFEPKLDKSFNRGFTDYFLEKRKDCYSFDSVNSKGEFLGSIKTTGKNYFTIDAKLAPQDGLWFENKNTGCIVNKVEGNKIYPNKMPNVENGTKVFRTFDSEFNNKLNKTKTKRKLFAHITINDGVISANDDYGNNYQLDYSFEEFATNSETMKKNIIKSFSKSGESIYEVSDVNINLTNIPFLPVSKLNELRRCLLNKLEERNFKYKIQELKPAKYDKTLDYRANILNKSAEKFYQNCNCKITEYAPESGTTLKNKCVMKTKHCLKYACGLCKKDIKLFLTDEKNKKYPLKFDCKNCEMEVYF